MRRLHLLLISILACAASVHAGDWDLIKFAGRDHVTLENVAQFYNLGGVQRVSNSVTLASAGRSLRGAVGSNELHINNLKFILSYPICEHNGKPIVSRMDLTKVIEPVLRPSRIKGAEMVDTVILDAGHGGHDNGALSLWGNEKSFTLDVVMRAKQVLEERGFKVYLTRRSDVFIPLEERVRIANRFKNAIFISVHFNCGGDSSATGIETYTLAPRGVPSMMSDGPRITDLNLCPGNVRDSENMALACATHASLICHSQLYDRGIKRARFVVIRDITIPGVLIEGGFLTCPNDSRRVATTQYRSNMALCIAAAVDNYRRAVGTTSPTTLASGQSVGLRNLGEVISEQESLRRSKENEPTVITRSTN